MTVYVDDAVTLWRGWRWAHLMADTLDELHAMAERLGVQRTSLSRELASNDWTATPFALLGSDLDRNVELVLPAPFDLEKISDADLDKEIMKRRATVLKNTKGAGA